MENFGRGMGFTSCLRWRPEEDRARDLLRGIRVPVGQQGIEEEQAGADHHTRVGDVEVRPVVAEDVDLDEIDNRTIDNTIVNITESPAANEGEGDGGHVDPVAETDHEDQHDQGRERGESDQAPPDGVG